MHSFGWLTCDHSSPREVGPAQSKQFKKAPTNRKDHCLDKATAEQAGTCSGVWIAFASRESREKQTGCKPNHVKKQSRRASRLARNFYSTTCSRGYRTDTFIQAQYQKSQVRWRFANNEANFYLLYGFRDSMSSSRPRQETSIAESSPVGAKGASILRTSRLLSSRRIALNATAVLSVIRNRSHRSVRGAHAYFAGEALLFR